MQLHSTRVMVIGLGVSGRAAASFLARRGAHLTMVDARPDVAVMGLPEGELHLGPDNPLWLRGIELVVISPGVPTSSALVRTARSASIPVIGELELASRFIEAPIVAVTGTNGKSTVTELVGRIFATAGLKTFIGGNLGTPLLEAVGGSYDVLVVEVSSYQLETIQRFKPRVAIYLNLSADHLDRYRDLAEYGRAKERIFENQDGGDFAILNRDDAMVWRVAPLLSARTIAFGLSAPSSRPAIWPEAAQSAKCDGCGGRCSRVPD
jgi:UDP-N-acetylmuramoylalanine--D-glutamate ligase